MASAHPRRKRSGASGKEKQSPQVVLSKSLSWILRHHASSEGIPITAAGYVKLSDLLSHSKFSRYTVEDIKNVVEQNEKQRFALLEDEETGELMIRANQGHSLEVPELELHELEPDEVAVAYHGTYRKCLPAIKRDGLSRMTRQHIHMTDSLPGSGQVISGMRGNCNAVVYVDVTKAMADGIKFFRSKNNVILSSGNDKGYLESKYFITIEEK